MVDRSGPTGVPRSPIRWQPPHWIGCDQNSSLPPARVAAESQDGPGPRVRAELPPLPLVRWQIAREQVVGRAVRELSCRGQQRTALGGAQLAAAEPSRQPQRRLWAGQRRAGRPGVRGPVRPFRAPVHPGDPSRDEVQARFVRPFGAEVRHPIAAELRHAEVQGARPGIARLDDAGIRQCEVTAGRTDADGLHLGVRDRKLEPQIDRPTTAVDMAVPAVCMEVRPGPGFQGLADIGRVGEPALSGGRSGVERRQWLAILLGPADQARFREGDELIASVGPRPIQLLRPERQGVLRPTAVTRHALAAAVERPHTRPRPIMNLLLGAIGRDQVGIGLVVSPGISVGIPVHAVVVQQLRLQPPAGPGRWTSPGLRPWGTAYGSHASPPSPGSAWPGYTGWRRTHPGRRPNAPPSRRPAIAGSSPRTAALRPSGSGP